MQPLQTPLASSPVNEDIALSIPHVRALNGNALPIRKQPAHLKIKNYIGREGRARGPKQLSTHVDLHGRVI